MSYCWECKSIMDIFMNFTTKNRYEKSNHVARVSGWLKETFRKLCSLTLQDMDSKPSLFPIYEKTLFKVEKDILFNRSFNFVSRLGMTMWKSESYYVFSLTLLLWWQDSEYESMYTLQIKLLGILTNWWTGKCTWILLNWERICCTLNNKIRGGIFVHACFFSTAYEWIIE